MLIGAKMNAPQGKIKRRVRGLQSPHAEMTNAARGNCNPRVRRFFLHREILERIADGEVVAERLAELRHIVVAAFARVVGCMDADAEVEANNKEIEVVA